MTLCYKNAMDNVVEEEDQGYVLPSIAEADGEEKGAKKIQINNTQSLYAAPPKKKNERPIETLF